MNSEQKRIALEKNPATGQQAQDAGMRANHDVIQATRYTSSRLRVDGPVGERVPGAHCGTLAQSKHDQCGQRTEASIRKGFGQSRPRPDPNTFQGIPVPSC